MSVPLQMSSEELRRVRWKGQGAYRALSHYFTIRWNRVRLGEQVQHVFGDLSIPEDPRELRNPPTPGLPASYSLIDFGPQAERRYRLLYGTGLLLSSDSKDDVLFHLFWHVDAEAFRQVGDFLLIHAGAVVSPEGEGIVMPGQAGSGKTTLTAGLVRAGFGYLSDEAAAIDPVTRRLYAYPKTLNLKEGSFALFADLRAQDGKWPLLKGRWHLRARDIRPDALGAACRLGHVIVPCFQEKAATEVTAISRAAAVAELWDNTWNLHLYKERALFLLGDAMRGASACRLVFGDLDEAVEAIRELATEERRPRILYQP